MDNRARFSADGLLADSLWRCTGMWWLRTNPPEVEMGEGGSIHAQEWSLGNREFRYQWQRCRVVCHICLGRKWFPFWWLSFSQRSLRQSHLLWEKEWEGATGSIRREARKKSQVLFLESGSVNYIYGVAARRLKELSTRWGFCGQEFKAEIVKVRAFSGDSQYKATPSQLSVTRVWPRWLWLHRLSCSMASGVFPDQGS